MSSSTLRLLAENRWPQPMMAYVGCFVPMSWVESQADCICSAINLEEVATAACHGCQNGMGEWRCLAVEKLSEVELCAEAWHTEPRSPQQTCIDEVDFDTDAQPGDDPQKGQ